MPKERESQLGSDLIRETFITIDDLVLKAEELTSGLRTICEYKHPLDIRKGKTKREGVMDVSDDAESRTVKAGAKTYFFDIKKTKEDKPYLVITESRFKGEGKERERVSIAVFPENTEDFAQAVGEMTAMIRKDM
jgi:hypothetical protein